MSVRLNGSTSGYVELDAPAVAGNNVLRMPTSNGSAGQAMLTDGAGNTSWGSAIVSGTAQNSTSGTSIDFTGIPSWVKRVTVMFSGVSTSGTSPPQVQLGTSAGFVTTGYLGSNGLISSGVGTVNFTTGFGIGVNTANWSGTRVVHGHIGIVLLGSNNWVASGLIGSSDVASIDFTAGSVTLSGALDRIRITTVNGTDTFDAGSINILYE